MSNLKNQAVNSMIWTTIRTVLTALCGPILLLVKTNYLTPAEFGVMALLNIFIELLHVIESYGLSQAVIQKDEVTKNERSSLFFFEIFFCIFIGILLIVTSPLLAMIFDMPSLRPLLSLLSLIVLANGPGLLFSAFLEKDFHFKELSIIQIIKEVIILITTFFFLASGFGLTGVVLGQIIATSVMTLLVLCVAFRYDLMHLRFHFRLIEIKSFVKFGVFVSGKQLMTNLTHNIDEIIIGYFLSSEILGLYHFAKNMLGKMRILISTSFSKVLFPILTKVKNDRSRLTHAYNNISRYIGLFAFPIFIGVAITARLFVPSIFGEEWTGSVPFFQILSIAFIPHILTGNLATSLLYSVGKPNIVFYTDLVVNSIYICLLIIVSWLNLGIYGVAILYTIYMFVNTTILQYLTSVHLHTTFKDYLLLFRKIFIISVFMALAVLGIQHFLNGAAHQFIEFIVSVVVGVTVFFVGTYILERSILIELRQLVFKR